MNLLEQHIKEIHSVEICDADWVKGFPYDSFVEVDVTTNCYGQTKRSKEVFEVDDWERYKSQGYWMA